jgi:exosortase
MSGGLSTQLRRIPLGFLPWLGPAFIVFWWVRDLSFQWSGNPEFHHGWLVAALTGFLIWERLESLPSDDTPSKSHWPLGLGLLGFPLVTVAELYRIGVARSPAQCMCLSVGCSLFLIGNILLLRGPRTLRHFAFPFLFFFLAVPIPKILWNPIVFTLQSWVSILDVELLNLSGIPAARQAHVILLPNGAVGVDEACSGIRSLQSSLMAALFIADLVLHRLSAKIAFFFLGIGLAIIGNLIRSYTLSVLAYRHGIDILERWHDTAGWSILGFTSVGVMALAWLLSRLEGVRNDQPTSDSTHASS